MTFRSVALPLVFLLLSACGPAHLFLPPPPHYVQPTEAIGPNVGKVIGSRTVTSAMDSNVRSYVTGVDGLLLLRDICGYDVPLKLTAGAHVIEATYLKDGMTGKAKLDVVIRGGETLVVKHETVSDQLAKLWIENAVSAKTVTEIASITLTPHPASGGPPAFSAVNLARRCP
jgi:hypothetical protein